jgi:large subunit ribosomal protein L19
VASRGEVRRAKLYYLRDRVGKRARVRERRSIGPEEVIERELLHVPGAEEPDAPETPDVEALAPDAATEAPEAEAPVAETAEAPDTAEASDSPDE